MLKMKTATTKNIIAESSRKKITELRKRKMKKRNFVLPISGLIKMANQRLLLFKILLGIVSKFRF